MGNTLTRIQVAQKATELAGRVPKNWVARFLTKHQSAITAAKGHGLNPQHAQAFNPTTVKDHFAQLTQVIAEYHIPPENLYNWDEKGIQLGGSQKGLQGHHIFAREDKECYVMIPQARSVSGVWNHSYAPVHQNFKIFPFS
ncbi:hypothetical protein K439DRAFT_1348112 [Ramaria rubella]|nr:hypothetical protein K439DRAFT_1348112 [Ramaria rubella]